MVHKKKFVSTACCAILLLTLTLIGCASIPKEAPELSAELGNRISAIEKAHVNLLHNFFNEKRAQVDKFITNEWIPLFTEKFFSNPQIEAAWQEITSSKDKVQRLKFLTTLGPKLQAKINSKRTELIAPLDKLERRCEQTLTEEYGQAKAINNSITSFLLSASKVDENRTRFLKMAGVSDQKIAKAIEDTDSIVSSLLEKVKKVDKKASQEKIDKYKTKLNDILGKL